MAAAKYPPTEATMRAASLGNIVLKRGSHKGPGDGFSAMEAVAFVAGEAWSDHPFCACPVIGAFMRQLNDCLPDDDTRTRMLGPLVSLIVGTGSSHRSATRRGEMLLNWMVREYAPMLLETVPSLVAHAEAMRSQPEIKVETFPATRETRAVIFAAMDAAMDAAAECGVARVYAASVALTARDAANAWRTEWEYAALVDYGMEFNDAMDIGKAVVGAWVAAASAAIYAIAASCNAGDATADAIAKSQESAIRLVHRMVDLRE